MSFPKIPFRNMQKGYVKNILSVYFNLHEVWYDNFKKVTDPSNGKFLILSTNPLRL